jgi:hypothetical protein
MHRITSESRSEFAFSGFVIKERSALVVRCVRQQVAKTNTSAGLHPTCDCEFPLRNVVSSIGVLPGEKRVGGAWRVRHDDDGGGRQWHSDTTRHRT